MSRLYKRGDIWWGWYYDIHGKRRRVSLQTTSKTIARKKLKALEALAADPASHQATQTLDECLTYYLDVSCATKADGTLHSYENKARHVQRLLGESTPITEIDLTVTEEYTSTRLEEGASTHTIHKELVVLRQALKVAVKRKLYPHDPRTTVPSVKVKYQPRKRWLTRTEFDALLDVTPDHRKMFIALGCLAGTNLGEAHLVQWSHVSGCWLHIPGTKRESRNRRVPINDELAAMLEERRGARDDLVIGRSWRRNNQRDLGVLCKRAGIERVTSNDLRRTFASWLKQEGVDSLTVAHLMGHTTTRMVELVYGRLSEDTYRDAVAKLPRRGLRVV